MKRFAFIFVFISWLLVARAELRVDTFEARPMDLSARTHEQLDRNGKICALVKVELPVEGCKFEGNVLRAHYDVNEYWVYLSGGTKMFNIKCPGERNLMVVFGDISEIQSLEGGVTYVLGTSGYTLAAATSNKANLSVETETPGASITINGQPKGNDRWSGQLEPGNYSIMASKKGYRSEYMSVTLAESESLHITIPALTASTSTQDISQGSDLQIVQTQTIAQPADSEAKNLDLCAVRDGKAYFFNESEWKALTSVEQAKYEKKGIVIVDGNERFLLGLDCSEPMTWRQAVDKYGEDRLPNEAQCRAMSGSSRYRSINNAIEAFGGTVPNNTNFFWGKSADDSSAWGYNMQYGMAGQYDKIKSNRVRAVVPLSVLFSRDENDNTNKEVIPEITSWGNKTKEATVYFSDGSESLSHESKSLLQAVSEQIKSDPHHVYRIVGWSVNCQRTKELDDIQERRVNAVYQYLLDCNVPKEQLKRLKFYENNDSMSPVSMSVVSITD